MRTLLVILALALAGCATPARQVDHPQVTEVPIAVAVTCVAELPPALPYPDTTEALKAAPDIFEATKLLLAGRVMRIQHEIELNIALAGCAGRVSK